jgi:hypothetical protein
VRRDACMRSANRIEVRQRERTARAGRVRHARACSHYVRKR